MLRRDLYMGHQSSDSPAMPMAGACTRALRPGTPRPAGRSSPAGLAGPPNPIPDPCRRAARPVGTLCLLPKPGAGSEAQRRRLSRSLRSRPRGSGAAAPASPAPGLREGDLATAGHPVGVAGRPPARPPVPPARGPHSLTFGRELAGAPRPSSPGGNPA